MEKIATKWYSNKPCVARVPVYAGVCTMCACLTLDRAEVTSQRTCLHMSVNAVFFLRCIHPVRLQCDIREIYGYFSRMRINIGAVYQTSPFRRRPGNEATLVQEALWLVRNSNNFTLIHVTILMLHCILLIPTTHWQCCTTGVGEYLKTKNSHIQVVLADPQVNTLHNIYMKISRNRH